MQICKDDIGHSCMVEWDEENTPLPRKCMLLDHYNNDVTVYCFFDKIVHNIDISQIRRVGDLIKPQ